MKLVLSTVLVLLSTFLSAQFFSGKILDETQRPLGNAKVYLDGTTISTVTDLQGNFSIDVS